MYTSSRILLNSTCRHQDHIQPHGKLFRVCYSRLPMDETSPIEEQLRILQQRNPLMGKTLPSFFRSSESEIAYFRCDKDDKFVAYARINPGGEIKNQFGISLEVPVVISLHTPLQPRVLDLFNALRSVPTADRDIGILVASDPKARLYALDKKKIGFPILVLLEQDLAELHRNSNLREKLAELLRSINYFDIKGEIRQKDQFFGRLDDIQKVLESVRTNQSIGVFGLRKSGKTSLLLQVRDHLDATGDISSFITFNEVSSDIDLRLTILERVRASISVRKGESFPRLRLLSKAGARNTLSSEDVRATWTADLKRILNHSGCRHILMLDEVDLANVEDGESGESHSRSYDERLSMNRVLRELRGVVQVQQESSDAKLVLVAAGVASSIVTRITRFDEENQLYQFLSVRALQPLSLAEVREMVRTLGRRSGLSFKEPQLFEFLFSQYGGHPQLTRLACSLVAESRTQKSVKAVPYQVRLTDLEDAADNPTEDAPKFGAVQNLKGFGKWYGSEFRAIDEMLRSSGSSLNPAKIPHAIDFGIFDRLGQLRMKTLLRQGYSDDI